MARGKTTVFIDNSNLFHGQLSAGWRIDHQKLKAYMEKDGDIWQVFLFASVKEPPVYKQTQFYQFIKNEMRYETDIFPLGRKTITCRDCGKRWTTLIEKGVDVALATKLLTLANARAFETAILVGADKDFLKTVQAVKNQGMRVEIFAWRGTISDEMEAESSSPIVYFDDIKDELEFTEKPDEEAEEQISEEAIEEEHKH